MAKIILKLAILSLLLIISLVSLINAEQFIYAGRGTVVYPTYIDRIVCRPFMPCGEEIVQIPSSSSNQNTVNSGSGGDGSRLYDELSSPGVSQVIQDQNSYTYNTKKYDTYNNYLISNSNNYYNNQQRVMVVIPPVDRSLPLEKRHFVTTQNTWKYNSRFSDGNGYYRNNNRDTIVLVM
jgi:hypothetical protein